MYVHMNIQRRCTWRKKSYFHGWSKHFSKDTGNLVCMEVETGNISSPTISEIVVHSTILNENLLIYWWVRKQKTLAEKDKDRRNIRQKGRGLLLIPLHLLQICKGSPIGEWSLFKCCVFPCNYKQWKIFNSKNV